MPNTAQSLAPEDPPLEPAHGLDGAWSALKPLKLDYRRLARQRILALGGAHPAQATFDTLRTKLLRSGREEGPTVVAVTAPTRTCGSTVLALNLAFSLARQADWRTVLIDLNLRCPAIARLLKLPASASVEAFLRRRARLDETFLRHGENLAIAGQHRAAEHAAETLQANAATAALDDLKATLAPDLVIVDMPPMLAFDDLYAFLPKVDTVLLVAAAGLTTMAEIDICEREIADCSTFAGLVLNKCRDLPAWMRT